MIVQGATLEGVIEGKLLTYRGISGMGYLTKIDEKNIDATFVNSVGQEGKFKLTKQ